MKTGDQAAGRRAAEPARTPRHDGCIYNARAMSATIKDIQKRQMKHPSRPSSKARVRQQRGHKMSGNDGAGTLGVYDQHDTAMCGILSPQRNAARCVYGFLAQLSNGGNNEEG